MERQVKKEKSREDIERERRLKNTLSKIKHTVLIISGKGGVGKTTVAVNLAYRLAEGGSKVGILDIDFHGPNIANDLDGVVVVTTPQDVAILDARKSVVFAKEVNVPVIGIIENMSGFTCPHCGVQLDLFSRGGGQKASEELGVPFLGSIPFELEMVRFGDEGKPYIHFKHDSETAKLMDGIVDRIKKSVGEK